LQVVREELEFKIQENEGVHIQRFEMKQHHEQAVHRLRESITDLQTQLQQKYSLIENQLTMTESWKYKPMYESKKKQHANND
jgi:hypothetical protein